MRKLIILFAVLTLFGCNQNSEIELIRPTEDNYIFIERAFSQDGRLLTPVYNISDEQVKKVSKTIEEIKKLLIVDLDKFEVSTVSQGSVFKPNLFLYTLYVNEKGKIVKVVSITSPSEKVDKFVVNQMKEWKMEIFKPQGNAIKYSINWEFSLFKPKGENYLSLHNSTLRVIEGLKSEVTESNTNITDYYVTVEEMPSPIGGMRGIAENVKYPKEAKESGIQGRVYVKVYIDENGNVTKSEVLKGIGGGCDEAAIKAVDSAKFNPGKKDGKPVKVQVSIPILFKLD